jgi:predicted metal-dependent phosphoesterase TrpH
LQPLEKTIAAVHAQGGFVVIPHPLSWLTFSVRQGALERILHDSRPELEVAGIETLNPSFAGRVAFERVLRLNRERWHLAETGGSDSHSLSLIGTAYTRFEGHTAEDFRRSLEAGTTRAGGHFWSLNDHTEIARQQMWRAVWVAPRQRFPRAFRMFLKEQTRQEPSREDRPRLPL